MRALPARWVGRPLSTADLLQIYLWGVMALLLVQGSGSLLLRLRPDIEAVTPLPLATLMNGNTPHAILHIVWGSFGLIYLAALHDLHERLWLSFTFGLFYTSLGFLALVVHDPFGMRLELPENLFHLTVGPVMLVLSYLAWRSPGLIVWQPPAP